MIELQIRPEVESQLADRARAAGMTLNDFVRNAVLHLAEAPGAGGNDFDISASPSQPLGDFSDLARKQNLSEAQEFFRLHLGEGRRLSDELIADRRREAANE